VPGRRLTLVMIRWMLDGLSVSAEILIRNDEKFALGA
jgi:hypothetical protein